MGPWSKCQPEGPRTRKPACKQKWEPEPLPRAAPVSRCSRKSAKPRRLSKSMEILAEGLRGSVNPLPTPHFTEGRCHSAGPGDPRTKVTQHGQVQCFLLMAFKVKMAGVWGGRGGREGFQPWP